MSERKGQGAPDLFFPLISPPPRRKMYRFSLPTEGDSEHPDWSESSPATRSRPEPPQSRGEGKRTAPPPLPLPAAPPRGSPRKQRRMHEDSLISAFRHAASRSEASLGVWLTGILAAGR